MNLSSNIVRVRKLNNMSQKELAKRLKVSRQTIYNWENNKSLPDLFNMVKISEMFHVPIDYLIKDNIMYKKTYPITKDSFLHDLFFHIIHLINSSYAFILPLYTLYIRLWIIIDISNYT